MRKVVLVEEENRLVKGARLAKVMAVESSLPVHQHHNLSVAMMESITNVETASFLPHSSHDTSTRYQADLSAQRERQSPEADELANERSRRKQ